MKRCLLILLWVLGILFPMAFLGRSWPAFGRVFDLLFAPDWVHVVMHAFLYLVLGILLATWRRPAGVPAFLLQVVLVLLVGVFHEALQCLTAGRWPGWGPELFDLGIDLSGGVLGIGLGIFWLNHRRPNSQQVP